MISRALGPSLETAILRLLLLAFAGGFFVGGVMIGIIGWVV
jgi:hypothetical protein